MTTAAPASTSANTKDPACNCPEKLKQTCDVKSLKLKVTSIKSADASTQGTGAPGEGALGWNFLGGKIKPPGNRELIADETKNKRGVVPADARKSLGKERAALLANYDIVLETTAQFAMGDKIPQNHVNIDVDVEWEGKCAHAKHGTLSWRTLQNPVGLVKWTEAKLDRKVAGVNVKSAATGTRGGIEVLVAPPPIGYQKNVQFGQQVVWAVNTKHVSMTDVYGQPSSFDLAKPGEKGAGVVGMAIRMLRMIWAFQTPMDLEFTATACGCGIDKPRVPNKALVGLVRVYRETSMGIVLKFPPARKVTESNVETITNGKIAYDEKKEREAYLLVGGSGYGGKTSKETSTAKPKSEVEKEKYKPLAYEIALKLNDLELTLKESSTVEADEKAAAGAAAKKQAITAIKDHANEIAVAWHSGNWIYAIKLLWQDMVWGWRNINQLIAKFWDAFKMFPQCGFKLEYEMIVLAGMLGIKFTQGDGDKVAERYYPFKWKGSFETKLTLCECTAKLSFGIQVSFVVGSVDVRVFGEIKGTVELGLEHVFYGADPDDGQAKVITSGTVCGRLGAIAAVESFFYTKKLEISIQAGLKVSGQILMQKDKTTYDVQLSSLPVSWQFVHVDSSTKTSEAKVHTLCKEANLIGWAGNVS